MSCELLRSLSGRRMAGFVAIAFLCLPAGLLSAESAKPNIVLIFADDLGWADTGFAGSDYCETPNLDRLAREGMIFRHAYSSMGNCAPSRACMLSGQYTPRHHVYAVGSTNRGPVELMRMLPVPNELTLPAKTVTLGEAMKSAGYATGYFGKRHLKSDNGTKAEDAGFDVVKIARPGLNSNNADDPKGIFSITSAACQFIETNKDQPFLAYLPHYAVHTRLEARKEALEHFRKKQPGKLHNNALYAACLAELDTGVGMVLDKLDELKLTEKTLVVFTSDNGGTSWSQEPLRGKKGGYYEGGIRVPTAVRWPGVVPPGSTCDEPIVNSDFYPTFLAAAKASPPSDHILDGADLLPLFRGEKPFQRQAIFWHFPGYLNGPVPRGRDPVFRTRPVSVIRKGDWKLLLYHEEWQLDGGREKIDTNRAVELYNLAEDESERKDLAGRDTEKRDELLTDLLGWMEKTSARLPTKANPAFNPDAAQTSPRRRRN
jgi:arylsulfatase A-like enzyme